MRTTNTFGIQFIARMNRVKYGPAPIYARVTVVVPRMEISLKPYYIWKLPIEKSILLPKDSGYSLAEVAYLTPFSDQSHFKLIFQKVTGKAPPLTVKA